MKFGNLLKLGLMAGAVAATGGAAAPAVLGAEAAGGAAAGGLLGAETAGLIGTAGTGAVATGAGSQAAMLAAQNEGFGAIGQQMLAQSAGAAVPMSVQAGAAMQSGLEGARAAGGYIKPVAEASMAANAISGLMGPEPQPVQPGHMQQGNPTGAQTLAQIYQLGQQGTQAQLDQAAQLRKQRQQMWG